MPSDHCFPKVLTWSLLFNIALSTKRWDFFPSVFLAAEMWWQWVLKSNLNLVPSNLNRCLLLLEDRAWRTDDPNHLGFTAWGFAYAFTISTITYLFPNIEVSGFSPFNSYERLSCSPLSSFIHLKYFSWNGMNSVTHSIQDQNIALTFLKGLHCFLMYWIFSLWIIRI